VGCNRHAWRALCVTASFRCHATAMIDGRTVHVVEDDAGMLDALCLLLRSANFDVRSYTNAEKFLAGRVRPQPICLLTDMRLPGMDGIALYRHLVRLGADPATVVITGHGDIPMAVAALKEGVVDFVEKPFDPALLLDSVREASQRAATNWARRLKAADVETRRSTLTPREAMVLRLLMDGHLNKIIAGRLGMSIRTAEHHRASIMEKMGARSVSHLIRMMLDTRD
jgi:two-component system response regulator FixJ